MAIRLRQLAQELGTTEENLRDFIVSLNIGVDKFAKKIDRKKVKIIKKAFLEKKEKELTSEEKTEPKEKKKVEIPEVLSVKELAEKMSLPVVVVIKELMKNKIFASQNEEIDFETAAVISEDLGFKVKRSTAKIEEGTITQKELQDILEKEDPANLKARPPVIVLMGHIDHGKTSLLDTIRKTKVVEEEAGKITQAISFCQVKKKGKLLTFIDTPGHEAFTKMREQGALISDIVILVVAADDGVKPQTKEVINHVQKKKIPLIVAINKVDKKDADIEKVKRELAENNVLCEGFGGKTVCLPVSAKTKKGVDELLDMVILAAEVEKTQANPERPALGTVLESHLDKNKGPVAMGIVQTGIIKEGDSVVSGRVFGTVRRMEDFRGKSIKEALGGTPVLIFGFNDVPEVGDVFQVVAEKGVARKKALLGIRKKEARERGRAGKFSLEEISHKVKEKKIKKLPLIIKADKKGSLKAILDTLKTFKTEEVEPFFLVSEVGDVNESDVRSAAKENAFLIGFKVGIMPVAKKLAEREKIEIKIFEVIYALVEYVKEKLEETLPKKKIVEELGKLKVLKIFMTGKKKMIVGGKVTSGKAVLKCLIRVKRKGEFIGKGVLAQLQQNKKDVKEVRTGNEAGISFEGDAEIQEGDILEFYQEKEQERKL